MKTLDSLENSKVVNIMLPQNEIDSNVHRTSNELGENVESLLNFIESRDVIAFHQGYNMKNT